MKMIAALVLGSAFAIHAADSIVVNAGAFDRVEAVVETRLPAGVSGLESAGGTVAVQRGPDGMARFVVRGLKSGESREYRFVKANFPVLAVAEKTARDVTLSIAGKRALVYRTEKTALPPDRPDLTPLFQRGGYIHPAITPGGRIVTDDYPVDHRHHHGVWFAWTSTQFEGRKPDFWNMGDAKGTVEFEELDRVWSGPVYAGFQSRHRQVDLTAPEPKTALNEAWSLEIYAIGQSASQPHFVFDLTITCACAGESVLKLPKYRYGGIGFRGPAAWNGKGNLTFLNSEGTTDRSKGDNAQTVGRWAHLGGLINGAAAGVAILGHPGNPGAPQPQRIHPTEPFFNFAPQQAGDFDIAPGKPMILRYRFVLADGAPDVALLNRLWNDYAHPPVVQ